MDWNRVNELENNVSEIMGKADRLKKERALHSDDLFYLLGTSSQLEQFINEANKIQDELAAMVRMENNPFQ